MKTIPIDRCPACGDGGEVLYAAARDHLYGVQGDWKYLRCTQRDCGVLWLQNRPADPSEPYQNYYTHDIHFRPRKLPRWLNRAMRLLNQFIPKSRLAAQRFESTCYLPPPEPGNNRLLEIGCGDGTNLLLLKAQGWDVLGQEIDPAAASASIARGLPVKTGQLATLQFEQAFDAIVSNHVLEHVDHEVMISTARKLLNPGGRLVIITPNADSLAHSIYRSAWVGVGPPFHWTIWTPRALQKAVAAQGFTVTDCFTPHRHLHSFLKHSARIEQIGTSDQRDYVDNRGELKAKLLELRLQRRKDENSNGEECVLIGVKP